METKLIIDNQSVAASGGATFDRIHPTTGEVVTRAAAGSVRDLAGLPLCLLTGDMQNRRIVNQHLSEAGSAAAPMVESNSTIALLTHVLTGEWVSVLPKKLAELFAQGGQIVAVPITGPEVEHLVGLIATHRDPPTPLIAALLDSARRIAEV